MASTAGDEDGCDRMLDVHFDLFRNALPVAFITLSTSIALVTHAQPPPDISSSTETAPTDSAPTDSAPTDSAPTDSASPTVPEDHAGSPITPAPSQHAGDTPPPAARSAQDVDAPASRPARPPMAPAPSAARPPPARSAALSHPTRTAPAPSSRHGDEERWPGTLILGAALRGAIPPQTDFDSALIAHGFGNVQLVPTLVAHAVVPVLRWLWIGGQIGVRGRGWPSGTHDNPPALLATDLLALIRARFPLARFFELGATVGAGIGWMGVNIDGVWAGGLAPRINLQVDIAFRTGSDFTIGPRIGWDYFRWNGINSYGNTVNAGGPYFGLAAEGRL